jgi:hypothetical protein
MSMKALALVLTLAFTAIGCVAWITPASAAAITMSAVPQNGAIVRVDWQEPMQLPPRFRNHCSVTTFSGRPYCANHCGSSYQFFYCSNASFGCCHLGHGYCDWNAHLRCAP